MDGSFSCFDGGAHTTVRRARAGRPDAGVGLALRRSQMSGQPDVRASKPVRRSRPMPASVLVVDDDPVFRDLARDVLAAEGLIVVGEAESLETALAIARALRPDAALVDIELPDGDGLTLAQRLSALAWRPRIVLTSTDPDAASPEDVRRSGAEAFVAKHELPNTPLKQLLRRD
jgi:CheY-like chemotaxis protein